MLCRIICTINSTVADIEEQIVQWLTHDSTVAELINLRFGNAEYEGCLKIIETPAVNKLMKKLQILFFVVR